MEPIELIVQEKRNFFMWRATAAITITDTGDMYLKVALCSPRDKFDAKQGANKAIGKVRQAIAKGEKPYASLKYTAWSVKSLRSAARKEIRDQKIKALDRARDYFVNRRAW